MSDGEHTGSQYGKGVGVGNALDVRTCRITRSAEMYRVAEGGDVEREGSRI